MVIVTGTKRSGTSMWMQILRAGGLEVVGEPFPASWGDSIREANPHGFYESTLRKGIFYLTNPDPKTGSFFPPGPTRHHAVKVFIPGLVRTDLAFVHRVIASMRHWREYGPSLGRLYAMEDVWLEARRGEDPDDARWKTARSPLPPAIEWWFDNYELVRDAATRRYPIHLVTYDSLLRDPAAVLDKVFPWLGAGDATAALDAVRPQARTQTERAAGAEGVEPEDAAVFDELYRLCDAGEPLSGDFLAAMNDTQHRLEERYAPAAARDRDDPRQEA